MPVHRDARPPGAVASPGDSAQSGRPFTRRPARQVGAAIVVLGAGVLAGCHSGSDAAATQAPAGAASSARAIAAAASSAASSVSSAAPAAATAAAGSGSGAKCGDLTNAAASASVGKATTVSLDKTVTALAGLTICNVTVADEVYPIQLAVNTANAAVQFSADKDVSDGKDLGGVGEKAFSSATGVEALSGGVDIKITGPAGPVLSNNFTVPIALAKAMISAL
jgi:hypothetical protein